MNDAATDRAPPDIVFVPPLDRPAVRPVVIVIGAIVLASVFLGVLVVQLTSGRGGVVLAFGLALLIAMSVFYGVLAWTTNRSRIRRRQEFLEKHPPDESDPRVGALAALRFKWSLGWKGASLLPAPEKVREILEESGHSEPPGGTIVCFGESDVPEVGEMHFEPEVVTPTGAVWKQLVWIAVAAALVVLWLLDYFHIWPPFLRSLRGFMGAFTYFVAAGIMVAVTWTWQALIRPRYVRMAPGVIQVLEYGFSKSKPTIRSYPMVAGTLAIFARMQKHLVLTLARDDIHDALVLTRAHRSKQVIERAWQALLSTAPTPPLSDDALVG